MSTYALTRYADEAEARADRPDLFVEAGPRGSVAMEVEAYEARATYGEPDPETGEQEMLSPDVVADGYWLLHACEDGADPITLPEGIVGISRIFAGMESVD